MAKIIMSDFGSIRNALNNLIIAETKAALRLVPEKRIEEGNLDSLCRIVVSDGADYSPRDLRVRAVWLDDNDILWVAGLENDDDYLTEYQEDRTDWLDITDFQYLIEQLKGLMPEGEYDLTNAADLQELDTKAHNKTEY